MQFSSELPTVESVCRMYTHLVLTLIHAHLKLLHVKAPTTFFPSTASMWRNKSFKRLKFFAILFVNNLASSEMSGGNDNKVSGLQYTGVE